MDKVESIGWLAKVVSGVQNFFGNYKTRVKNSLIDTGDALVFWTGQGARSWPRKKDGTLYSREYVRKKILHYRRQWKANRKKLR